MAGLEDTRGQGRREGQGDHPGEDHGDGDGDGELLVEGAGHAAEEGDRQEHRAEHQDDGDQRPGQFRHGLFGRLHRRHVQGGHVVFDVFDDDDGVVDHQADGQDHAEQGQHVGGEAEQVDADVGADDGDRHGQDRDDGGTETLQEEEHHQDHQNHRLEEGVDDLLDGGLGELAGVENDLVFEPVREAWFQLVDERPHLPRGFDGVGPGLLVDDDGHRPLAVDLAGNRVVLVPQFGVADVLEADDGGAGLIGAQDDVLELLRIDQHPLGGDHEALLGAGGARVLADLADAVGLVLALDGGGHLLGGDPHLRQAVGFQPDAHGHVRHREHAGEIGAGDALDRVKEIKVAVVRQVGLVVAVVGGEEADDHHEGVGTLLDGDPLLD